MTPPVITLLTDFGLQDGYVASMKGVILGICPDARTVDISHLIAPQSIRSAGFVLFTTYACFPESTIHLAVVDPGVGTERRPIAIRAGSYCFIGPDNGLFSPILAEETDWEARRLENSDFWRKPVSKTFHGRDIFAPVAAHLACGIPFESLGPVCHPTLAPWNSPIIESGEIEGEVIHIDRFGNAITNVRLDVLERQGPLTGWSVRAREMVIDLLPGSYARARLGEPLALGGSSGFVEIAVNGGDAASQLELGLGARVAFLLSRREETMICPANK